MKYQKRIYDLRVDNDLRQEDIANILNTTKQNYGMYENGKRKLNIEDLIKLCEFYKVSSDYILGLTDNPEPSYRIKNQININGKNQIKKIEMK